MGALSNVLSNLPEVASPTQKKLSFQEKLKWTLIVLVLFFVLGLVPLYGLEANQLQRFELLSIILGAKFGSVISLGIGPIVTASIVLQLLNGAGILKFDLTTHEGKKMFQGVQKASALLFTLFEAAMYVYLKGFPPRAGISPLVIVFQLVLGGILILFMDEVVSKWGFGSGISLFIAAGVSEGLVVRLLSPLTQTGALYFGTGEAPVGAIFAIFHFLPLGDVANVAINLAAIAATVLVFILAVYAQSMKVEIPLSFGRVRGQGIRWPLSFIYTSNIPVILVAALIANIQLFAMMLSQRGINILGTFVGSTPSTGIVAWLHPTDIVGSLIKGSLRSIDVLHAGTYILFMIVGSVIFSHFWVQTSGLDPKSQAKQMMASGLQIPGFRRDERVLERLLERYIGPLTIMGAIAVGFLAATADLTGALTSGTGLLLSVMIVYNLYESISQQHMMDMNPMLRKFMEK